VDAGDLEDLAPGPYLRSLSVRTDTGEFLLGVSLPAVDIDGYSGLYSSSEGRWQVHHNDSPAPPEPRFDRDGPLLECGRRDGAIRCESRSPS
jgi:hypothetical protein